jgi:hypothetical protein
VGSEARPPLQRLQYPIHAGNNFPFAFVFRPPEHGRGAVACFRVKGNGIGTPPIHAAVNVAQRVAEETQGAVFGAAGYLLQNKAAARRGSFPKAVSTNLNDGAAIGSARENVHRTTGKVRR